MLGSGVGITPLSYWEQSNRCTCLAAEYVEVRRPLDRYHPCKFSTFKDHLNQKILSLTEVARGPTHVSRYRPPDDLLRTCTLLPRFKAQGCRVVMKPCFSTTAMGVRKDYQALNCPEFGLDRTCTLSLGHLAALVYSARACLQNSVGSRATTPVTRCVISQRGTHCRGQASPIIMRKFTCC